MGSGYEIKQSFSLLAKQLFCPVLAAQYTWTGKSYGATRKKAFNEFKEVHNLIFNVIHSIDSRYTLKQCHDDIVYRLMKYAYNHKSEILSS